MSSWRVLELSEQPDGEPIPQLLVKPAFNSDSYTVFLTCLTNIWSEDLDLHAIVRRAAQQQSPIEISEQDTTQLNILLDNLSTCLSGSDDAECRLTRNGADGITLHTMIRLPEPLDSLTWEFHLQRRSPVTLKNELILGRRVHRDNRRARLKLERLLAATGVSPKLTRVLGVAPTPPGPGGAVPASEERSDEPSDVL